MEKPNGEPEQIFVKDLAKEYYRLMFLVDTGDDNIRREMEIPIQAGNLVNYIMGNPLFIGQAMRTKEQANEMQDVFAPSKAGGKLDYVAGWYEKSADIMKRTKIQAR